MPFTIISQPDAIALTGNPLAFEILCLDGTGTPFQSRGIRARLQTTGYIAYNGTQLGITFREPNYGPLTTVNFTPVATPSSPIEIPNAIGSYGTALAYWQAVAAIIASHPSISKFLSVYVQDVGTGIAMWTEVKKYETGWTLNTLATGASNHTVTQFPDLLITQPPNYRLHCTVFVQDSYTAPLELIAEILAQPDRESTVRFDLSDILHKAIEASMPTPGIPNFSATSSQLLDINRAYQVRFWESIGESSSTYINHLTVSKRALLGGISQAGFAAVDFFASLGATNSFLSWYPDRKTINLVQPEWLPWYNHTGAVATVGREVTYYYENGTSNTVNQTNLYPSIQPGQVWLCASGVPTLNPALLAGCVKYAIRLISAPNTYVSESRTYFLDRDTRSTRYLVYLNAFHVPLLLRCTGQLETEIEIERQLSEAILPDMYGVSAAQSLQYDQLWRNLFTYRTGYLRRVEALALQELLIYSKLYEVSEYGYLRLQLIGKAARITEDRENLHSYEIACAPSMYPRWYYQPQTSINNFPPPSAGAWLTDLLTPWQTDALQPWQIN